MQEDSEGNTTSFESVIAQLFEALLAIADSNRFQQLMRPALPELIHTTIGQLLSMQGAATGVCYFRIHEPGGALIIACMQP